MVRLVSASLVMVVAPVTPSSVTLASVLVPIALPPLVVVSTSVMLSAAVPVTDTLVAPSVKIVAAPVPKA